MSGSWRVAMRLARRDVSAHRRRSFLTASLIGLPVLFAGIYTALVMGATDLTFAVVLYLPIMLLIVLLTIPAFGVTARARRDELDLLASTGGTQADLRRTITAVGLVTGVLGAAGGLLLAVPGWLALVAVINRLDEGQHTVASLGDLALWPFLAAVAVGSSVAAALITAATLPATPAGRDTRPGRRWLAVGIVLVAAGALGIASRSSDSILIAAWTTLLGAGVALMTPTLVHVTSKASAALPLPARLAARDADRHRMRTAPAIAAVMAGVAAVTALGIGSFSDNQDRLTESVIYPLPVGAVTVYGESAEALESAVRAGASEGVALLPMGTPAEDEHVSVEFSHSGPSGIQYDNTRFDVVVADADTVQGWGVALEPEAVAALDAGRALAGPTAAVRNGRLAATLEDVDAEESDSGTPLVIPAVPADLEGEPVPDGVRSPLARVVIPPDLARSLGLDFVATSAVVDRRGPAPSDDQLTALEKVPGVSVEVQQEARFASYHLIFALLTLLGVGVVGLSTATAVALARLDGREDAATLVSVGARPSTTRWSAAAAALLIGGLGSMLGLLVGVLPGMRAATSMTGGYGEAFVAIPWALLATVGIVIPLVVAGVAFATAPVRSEHATSSLR
ncbi:hypothetical protein H9L21_13170 [Aeromicrobium senzhongii]|uniref:FtsX-like permease family protein n=1 Tax=Aeromicrobium senzhongii TaxID=2663859 RepID=A0ABX6SRL2_9ACTN|nr:hypothetical protein [Aeromicrobium senzhongii]MTB88669.1 hypothetical protein [Aeromicrobium senzhongii]QNL94028.1 hypothetical protein H9L21_13170 [Aeromicrobium senzhongii]